MRTPNTGPSLPRRTRWRLEYPLHLMLLPGIVFLFIFRYAPMIGNAMAFQDFVPGRGFFGSRFVGLHHFRTLFQLPNIWQVFSNTLSIAVLKIAAGTLSAICIALMLNETRCSLFRRTVQTIIYLPHFLSWVILGSVLTGMLGGNGLINNVLSNMGAPTIFFLGKNDWFRFILILSHVLKEAGYGTIIYLAAITGIDPTLYEAAIVDGANRLRQTWHITLPGMRMIIVLMGVLNLGNILDAGFDQIFNMYNSLVMESADIIDTLVYRLGLVNGKFSLATAVGLLKSVVSLVLISTAYYTAYRVADYRVF